MFYDDDEMEGDGVIDLGMEYVLLFVGLVVFGLVVGGRKKVRGFE